MMVLAANREPGSVTNSQKLLIFLVRFSTVELGPNNKKKSTKSQRNIEKESEIEIMKTDSFSEASNSISILLR